MTNKPAAGTLKQTTVTLSLSPLAAIMLLELAEKASAPGAHAVTLAELYTVSQRAKQEAELLLKE